MELESHSKFTNQCNLVSKLFVETSMMELVRNPVLLSGKRMLIYLMQFDLQRLVWTFLGRYVIRTQQFDLFFAKSMGLI